MSNDHVDPSGNTGQFQAFAQAPAETTQSSRTRLVIGGVVALAFVALVAYLAFS